MEAMEAGFLRHNIEFAPDEQRVSRTTRFLNAAGNALLSPVRHLLRGRTVTVVNVQDEGIPHVNRLEFNQKPASEEGIGKKALKTTASVLLFVPGLLLGSLVKGVALATSSSLRNRYKGLSLQIKKDKAKAVATKYFADLKERHPPTSF